MTREDPHRVCPVERAGGLDSGWRRLVQNPRRLLAPYIRPGAVVLDYGCGPGFFVPDAARLVGEKGKVIAVDLQRGMLDLLERKPEMKGLETRVETRTCPEDAIGIDEPIDFALLFYVVHETPDQAKLFAELAALLKPDARALLVEPGFHVKRREFAETLDVAERAGLRLLRRPFRLVDHAAVLGK